MVKYFGSKFKVLRKTNIGNLPGLTQKNIKNKKSSGEHGKESSLEETINLKFSNEYKIAFLEKQKLCFNYNITNKQLFLYYKKAKKKNSLLKLLENRLDCILFRLGYGLSILSTRQLITHKHIFINQRCVNIPNYQCKKNDEITIKKNIKSINLILPVFKILQKQRETFLKKFFYLQNFEKKRIQYIFKRLIPKNIFLVKNNLGAKIISYVHQKEISIIVNELKVIEYYSYR
jgi:small subunit ribosomal protein S4